MEVLDFLKEHLRLIVEIVTGAIVLAVARRPLFAYIRSRVEKMNTQQEVDHFKILRNEVAEVNRLWAESERKHQHCHREKEELKNQLTRATEQLKLYTENGSI